MVRGKESAQWWHTAALMALVANCHRDSKRRARPYSAKEFHPDTARRSGNGNMLIDKDTMSIVVGAFVSPERAKAAEFRAALEQEQAAKLAARMRSRLRAA